MKKHSKRSRIRKKYIKTGNLPSLKMPIILQKYRKTDKNFKKPKKISLKILKNSQNNKKNVKYVKNRSNTYKNVE